MFYGVLLYAIALEENMFDDSSESLYPKVFLRPRETVHIPFKFQSFKADQSVPEQVSRKIQIP